MPRRSPTSSGLPAIPQARDCPGRSTTSLPPSRLPGRPASQSWLGACGSSPPIDMNRRRKRSMRSMACSKSRSEGVPGVAAPGACGAEAAGGVHAVLGEASHAGTRCRAAAGRSALQRRALVGDQRALEAARLPLALAHLPGAGIELEETLARGRHDIAAIDAGILGAGHRPRACEEARGQREARSAEAVFPIMSCLSCANENRRLRRKGVGRLVPTGRDSALSIPGQASAAENPPAIRSCT